MKYDIAIIGGGSGGYVAAIYGARMNAKIALIEEKELGGTCLNRGCIPTKALFKTASLFNKMKTAERFGISTSEVKVDWENALKNQQHIVDTLKGGVRELLKSSGVDIYNGRGKLVDNKLIQIDGPEGLKQINAKNIIIATGAIPEVIPIPGSNLENVITSDEALIMEELPESLLIVGGGVIGVELGYIFNTLGTKVTIIEMLPEILPKLDEQIAEGLRYTLENQGIDIYTKTVMESISKNGSYLKAVFTTQDEIKELVIEKVLMATGRKPVIPIIEGNNLKATKSGIIVDDYNRTNIENVYAIGDVTGGPMLAHVASYQGILAVKNALGDSCKMSYNIIPSCIYVQPEAATVGLTEEESRKRYGDKIKIGIFPLNGNGKALTLGETEGFIKIISESKYNEIIGVHIVGPNATELIAEATLAIKMECTAEELVDTIHAHPTLSEAVAEACFDLLGLPLHKL